MSQLIRISGDTASAPICDIVFVHGLMGHPRKTWLARTGKDRFWPEWLAEDCPESCVWSIGYELEATAWKGTAMPLEDRAVNVLDLLDANDLGTRPLSFVAHSAGGLLVKQMLRHAAELDLHGRISSAMHGVAFFSTPHTGSDIANLVQYLGKLLRPTVAVKELRAHEPRLRYLNTWYRTWSLERRLAHKVFIETRKTSGVQVVKPDRGDPGLVGVVPVPVDADHVSICKLDARQDQRYLQTLKLAREAVARAGGTKRIEIVIDGSLAENDAHLERLRYALAGFLGIAADKVRVIDVKKGSVRVTVELPSGAAQRLLEAYHDSESDLRHALGELRVIGVTDVLEDDRAKAAASRGGSEVVRELAADLSSTTTRMAIAGGGIVLDEPSLVAVETEADRVVGIGSDAEELLRRDPELVRAVHPLRREVVRAELTEVMISHFIKKLAAPHFFVPWPRILVGVPPTFTDLERRAVRSGAHAAGAREVYMVSEPMAAAIGVGLPVATPAGSMVVDMGGETTEIAVISLANSVADMSTPVGGDGMDAAIITLLREDYELLVGHPTAEAIKIQIGSAYPLDEEKEMMVKGRDLISGAPKTLRVHSAEIRACLEEPIQQIVRAVRQVLEITPPELASDIAERGIVITGGGALLRGLDILLRERTGLPVHVDEEPLTSAVRGCVRILDNLDRFHPVLTS